MISERNILCPIFSFSFPDAGFISAQMFDELNFAPYNNEKERSIFVMSKIESIRKEMMIALKSGDKARKDALSLLLSALKNKQIDKQAELTVEEENAVIFKEIREAQETIDTTPADRVQVIEECRKRIAVYSEFVPRLMDAEELRPIIAQVLSQLCISKPTPADKGKIMKALMPQVKGKADGKLVNTLVSALFEH